MQKDCRLDQRSDRFTLMYKLKAVRVLDARLLGFGLFAS